MVSDPRAMAAREAHRRASEAQTQADGWRAQRDGIVQALSGEGWSYKALAGAVRCSESLIAAIVKGRTGRKTP